MGLFGGSKKDPLKEMMPYLQKAEDAQNQYYQPYIDIGMGVAPGLQEQYGMLMNDPAAMLAMFMGGYEETPYYSYMEDKLGTAAANSAAAGGMRGSGLDQARQQEITRGLLSQDMQQYLGNVTGLYGQGLAGNQGLFDTGYGASSSLADNLSNIYGTQGQLAYQGAMEGNARNDALWGSLMGLGAGAIGTVAGPAGAAFGKKLGSGMYDKFFGGK